MLLAGALGSPMRWGTSALPLWRSRADHIRKSLAVFIRIVLLLWLVFFFSKMLSTSNPHEKLFVRAATHRERSLWKAFCMYSSRKFGCGVQQCLTALPGVTLRDFTWLWPTGLASACWQAVQTVSGTNLTTFPQQVGVRQALRVSS